MNFEVAIPTYKRKGDLNNCLKSIFKQSALPERVLIIDDDELPDDFISKWREKFKSKKVKLAYYEKDHSEEKKGSSASKNKAIELAEEEIIFIFDDDIVLKEGYFQEIMKLWKKNKNDENLIGISGIDENYRKKGFLEKGYNKIFGLDSDREWDVNGAGYQVWNGDLKKARKGYYMYGFCCSYKTRKAEKIKFTVFKQGRDAGEDVDFCLRSKNEGYHFLINPEAKVIHNQSPAGREKAFKTGFKEISNKKIIFRNNCKGDLKNFLWFFWASIGWTLRQFLIGNFRRGAGMIKGLVISVKD